jgi:membrane-associated phospholipid phosphatase
LKSAKSFPASPVRPEVLGLIGIALYVTGCFYNTALFRLINGYHSDLGDRFFLLVTCLGDGLVLGVLLFFPWRRAAVYTLLGLESLILSGILARILKESLGFPRPPAVLDRIHVVGTAFFSSSFPSGHTASAFAVGFLAYACCRRRLWKYTAIILAMLVGYSRVYMGLHFPRDVLAGGAIGVLGTWLVLRHKASLQCRIASLSEESRDRFYRVMTVIWGGGGVALLLYNPLPEESAWLGSLLGISVLAGSVYSFKKAPDWK